LMHLHNLLRHVLPVALVTRFYRQRLELAWVAGLAAQLYARTHFIGDRERRDERASVGRDQGRERSGSGQTCLVKNSLLERQHR